MKLPRGILCPTILKKVASVGVFIPSGGINLVPSHHVQNFRIRLSRKKKNRTVPLVLWPNQQRGAAFFFPCQQYESLPSFLLLLTGEARPPLQLRKRVAVDPPPSFSQYKVPRTNSAAFVAAARYLTLSSEGGLEEKAFDARDKADICGRYSSSKHWWVGGLDCEAWWSVWCRSGCWCLPHVQKKRNG